MNSDYLNLILKIFTLVVNDLFGWYVSVLINYKLWLKDRQYLILYSSAFKIDITLFFFQKYFNT